MSGRREEYQLPSGHWSQQRRDAVLVPQSEIIRMAVALDHVVPACYYLGTAQHETNFATNERDTEPSGFQSWGLYQLSLEEANRVALGDVNLLAPEAATLVLYRLTQQRRELIRRVAKLEGPDPPDLCAYLAIAHNQGEHAVTRTILGYGLDWRAYKRRNPTLRIVSSHYGDDVCPLETVPPAAA